MSTEGATLEAKGDSKAKPVSSRRRLVFFHIPKCGGTTIYASLCRIFDPSEVFLHHGEVNVEGLEKSLVVTHAPFNNVVFDADRDWLITNLRNPVVRLRSLYQYWSSVKLGPLERRSADDEDSKAVNRAIRLTHELSFEEYLRSDDPGVLVHTDNALVRHFTKVSGKVTEKDFKQARSNIEQIDQFIFAEDMIPSLNRLFNTLGKLSAFVLTEENVTAALVELEPENHDEPKEVPDVEAVFEADETIASRVKWDARLYNYALELTNSPARNAPSNAYFPVSGLSVQEVTPNVASEFSRNPSSRSFVWGTWSGRDDNEAWALGAAGWLRFKVARAALNLMTSPVVSLDVHAFLPSTRRSNQVDMSLASEPSASRVIFVNPGFSAELRAVDRDPRIARTLVVAGAQARLNLSLGRDGAFFEDPDANESDKENFATFRIDFSNMPALPASRFGHQDDRTLGFSIRKIEVRDLAALEFS